MTNRVQLIVARCAWLYIMGFEEKCLDYRFEGEGRSEEDG